MTLGTVGSLFSGCMGLDLGLEAAGWEIAWACENDPACRRVISRHKPHLTVVPDVREVDECLPHVDVLAGGFPCQDLSQAGSGAGLSGERSGLWHEMSRAIRALQPGYVIVENVPGIATKMGSRPGESALGTVVADLAEAGYVGSWIRLRASDVGAPHKRERVFILATNPERVRVHTSGGVRGGGEGEPRRSSQEAVSTGPQVARAEDAVSDSAAAADAERERFNGRGGGDAHPASGEGDRWSFPAGSPTSASHADSRRRAFIGITQSGRLKRPSGDVTDGSDREGQAAADADGERRAQHGGTIPGEAPLFAADGDSERRAWGIYAPAILRWEGAIGRSAPRPTDDRGRLNPEFTAWMMGFPPEWTKQENRTQQLRMLGNSVVVQVGEVVGRMLRG